MKGMFRAVLLLLLACAAGIRAQPVHVVLFTHIEDNTPAADLSTPQAKLQYAQIRASMIATAKLAQSHGLRWCLQPDWKILLASLRFEDSLVSPATNGKPFLRYLREDLGAVIDPHSHEKLGYNYTDVAHLLDSLGVGGSTVIGGHIWDPALPQFQNWDRFRTPVRGTRYPWALWRGDILMGSGTPNHVNDPVVSGVWQPRDRDHYWEHDPAGSIAAVGQFTSDMTGLARLIALRRSGAVPATCMLTISMHLTPSGLGTPGGRAAVEDTLLKPLAALRDAGDVVVTDFTALVATWKSAYGGEGCLYRPGVTSTESVTPSLSARPEIAVLATDGAGRGARLLVTLPRRGHALLTLVSLLGTRVATVCDAELDAGAHDLRLDAGGIAAGCYLLLLRTPDGSGAARIVLLR